ncbi:MAG: FAD-dependent oxidoreductase [Chloroflexota bacterium]|nr:FAD-dependent oxidoreductase [Chloroflexota bacterium]
MKEPQSDILIVGGGIMGISTALELRARGQSVTIIDPGPLPHPLAASTDISKVVRIAYGADEFYMALGEVAMRGWHDWNAAWGEPLYHEVGTLMITRAPMQPGDFEYDSRQTFHQRGHQPDILDADEITRRYPAWKHGTYVDGFYHAGSGYAESGRVVAALIEQARREGVTIYEGQTFAALIEADGRVVGVRTREGATFRAGQTLVAAGTWTHVLIPELAPFMRSTGHPVFHLKTDQPEAFMPSVFPVFTADISHTGWYGFPIHPREGVIKIANHGAGQLLHPENDPRVVTADDEAALRSMLADTFPALLDAPIVYTRRCVYCDVFDGDFWIDRHPERAGLTVAAGGSGHAFKFAPVLGGIIADAVEGRANEWLHRFCWRDRASAPKKAEASRYQGALA